MPGPVKGALGRKLGPRARGLFAPPGEAASRAVFDRVVQDAYPTLLHRARTALREPALAKKAVHEAIAPVGDESEEGVTVFGEHEDLGRRDSEGGVEGLADPRRFLAGIAALDLERAFHAAGTPPDIQEAIVARYVEGRTWAEVAARYQLHPDVVRKEVKAHLRELQQHLPDYRPAGRRRPVARDRTLVREGGGENCPFCRTPLAGRPPITCQRCRTAIPRNR